MTDLITQLFSSFTTTIQSMTGGIKDAFMNVLYVDPAATTPVISDLAKFVFIIGGISLALGLVSMGFSIIRRTH